MADHVLFIGWDAPVRGREERSLEVFEEAVALYGRLQQAGRIEGFDIVFLTPHGGLGGYFTLHGSQEQIAAVHADAEFMTMMTDASLCVEGLREVDGLANAGIAEQMTRYRDAVAKVPQLA